MAHYMICSLQKVEYLYYFWMQRLLGTFLVN